MLERSLWLVAGVFAATLVSTIADAESEATAAVDVAKEARQAMAQLRREGDKCGLKLAKSPEASQPDSFRVVLQASPFQLAFYTDAGPWLSPLPSAPGFNYGGMPTQFLDAYTGVPLRVKKWGAATPTGSPTEYFERLAQLGDGATLPPHVGRRAEVVMYTVDGNGDGVVDAADKQTAGATSTALASDVALHRHVYGTSVVDGTPTAQTDQRVVARGIRIWVGPGDELGKGRKAGPIFTYRLSEQFAAFDLNDDGDTDDELVFGDSDGDGQLSAAEQDTLLKSNANSKSGLVDNLDLDARFVAPPGDATKKGLLDRVRAQFPAFSDAQARQFLRNAIVRVDAALVIEYEKSDGGDRVRRRIRGRAAFRNPLMRLLGLTR